MCRSSERFVGRRRAFSRRHFSATAAQSPSLAAFDDTVSHGRSPSPLTLLRSVDHSDPVLDMDWTRAAVTPYHYNIAFVILQLVQHKHVRIYLCRCKSPDLNSSVIYSTKTSTSPIAGLQNCMLPTYSTPPP